MASPPPELLDRLLEQRRHEPPPLDLRRDVWWRISVAESRAAAGGLRTVVEGWFAQWPFAALFVTTCILVGLLCAEVRQNGLDRERNVQLARSYLVLINPLLQEGTTLPKP